MRVLGAATGSRTSRPPVFTRFFWGAAALALAALTLFSLLRTSAFERLELVGTKDAPGARGEVRFSGRTVDLTVSGLPPLPPGRVYQLWHLGLAGAPVPARTFTADASGTLSGRDTLASPVARGEGFAITREPAGGSRSPTLPLLLVPAP